jgi:hypothetical protein
MNNPKKAQFSTAKAQRKQRAAKKINNLTRFSAASLNHPKGE